MGHLCGAVAGLLVGLVVLENRRVEDWESRWLKPAALVLYLGLLAAAVVWHLVSV